MILIYIKMAVKYILLFGLTYFLLLIQINFFLTLCLIIMLNIIFIKIELKYHLSTKMSELIKKNKYQEAVRLGEEKHAEKRDVHSKILFMVAYFKSGQKDNAIEILKIIEKRKWRPKRVRKIVDYWKVRMLLDSPYQLN